MTHFAKRLIAGLTILLTVTCQMQAQDKFDRIYETEKWYCNYSIKGISNSNHLQANGVKHNDPLVTAGIIHTGDFYKHAAGAGLGVMVNFGRTSHFLNACVGAEYVEYLCGDPRPDDQKGKLPLLGGGGQVVFPALIKLQLFRTSKWTKFYIGCGCEAGVRIYESNVLKAYYEHGEVFRKSSFAIVPLIGWRMRNVDFGAYYKHYISKPFNHSIDGQKDLGDDKARIGYHLTYYF